MSDSSNHSSKAKLVTLFTPDSHNMPTRRYDLDGLRVLVFGLLILYHIGMMYVENWGFHIKSSYLDRPSKRLSYLSEAVYSYYIVHQTIIIAAGYELSQLALGPVVVTTVGCFASYEMVRRIEWLRPFFGLKLRGDYSQKWQTA